MSEEIQLPVLAKHFRNTAFYNDCNCALAKAAIEHFNANDVREGRDRLFAKGVWYSHFDYTINIFHDDLDVAHSNRYDNTLIRTITLTPC